MVLQGYALTDILYLLPTATSYMRRRDASKKKKKKIIIFLSDIGYHILLVCYQAFSVSSLLSFFNRL